MIRDLKDNETPATRLKILVAEDNRINRLVAQKMIEFLGHRAECVGDGEAAVTAVREGDYDIVLMDCQMPLLDGYEATRVIRGLPGNVARVPIVAVTARNLPGDDHLCREAGMDDFVAKPILPDNLAAVIERVTR